MIQYNQNTMGLQEKSDLENTKIGLVKVNETSEIAFVVMAESGTIDEVTAAEHMDSFEKWQPNVKYKVGQLRTYGDGDNRKLYRCVQEHTSQADWTPDVATSLWVVAGDPAEEWPAWSQPIGAHDAYDKGAKASHNGERWVSEIDDNVWEPGAPGVDERYWRKVTE